MRPPLAFADGQPLSQISLGNLGIRLTEGDPGWKRAENESGGWSKQELQCKSLKLDGGHEGDWARGRIWRSFREHYWEPRSCT